MTSSTFESAMALVSQLSVDEQRELLRTLQDRLASTDEEWALHGEQLAFMLAHKDEIDAAYETDEMASLDLLEQSDEYQALFREMSWDEAYDRFEETWWVEGE